ncbi:sensor histidine kinase CpxA [Abditibacteriota bacterium]|nr:sensor histidine kinase CpxA [Abditibacteriota bacterium]
MRTLFWKIFAWFGAAQLLIAVSLYLFASATQRGFDRGLARAVGASLETRTRAAAVAYEAGGLKALKDAWRFSPRRWGRGRNREKTSSAPSQDNNDSPPDAPPPGDGPPGSDGGGDGPPFGGPAGFSPDGPEDRRGASLYVWKANEPVLLVGPKVSSEARKVVATAFTQGSAVFDSGNDEDLSFLARRIETPSGARYVGIQPTNFHGRGMGPLGEWLRPDGRMLARFSVIGLLMVGLCFWLGRYLSAPARKLRDATHQFAAGDLSTRVGPSMGRRRDELADLGRDFDAMAERIEKLVTSQNRLLADISHELRTPLARLNVAVELAADTADEVTRSYLERIKEESGELDTMIGQLLTLQRLESRQTQMLKVPIDLDELVSHVVENVDFEAQSRGARVEIKRLDTCSIDGNAELLRSALQNVTRNAILHSGQPYVEVSLEKHDFFVLITVRDYGPGVPEEALGKLFDPFYRVDTDRARQTGGTGLGLSITKRAVEAHDGTVQAINAEGGGLKVEIQLPVIGKHHA